MGDYFFKFFLFFFEITLFISILMLAGKDTTPGLNTRLLEEAGPVILYLGLIQLAHILFIEVVNLFEVLLVFIGYAILLFLRYIGVTIVIQQIFFYMILHLNIN